jgi:RNA polymerase sigma factor (sigma-70 family)
VTEPLPRRSTAVISTMSAVLEPPTSAGPAPLDFDALYRGARDDVYAYVVTLLRDRGAAEDVTAQAFERAFRKAGSYDHGKGGPRAWLFGIARHAALDELRRRKRTATLAGDPADASGTGGRPVEEAAERAVERAAVRAALAGLPPRDRELIALKFHAGLDNAELATVLGVSVSNAGTQLHRAMTKLRRAVDDRS